MTAAAVVSTKILEGDLVRGTTPARRERKSMRETRAREAGRRDRLSPPLFHISDKIGSLEDPGRVVHPDEEDPATFGDLGEDRLRVYRDGNDLTVGPRRSCV